MPLELNDNTSLFLTFPVSETLTSPFSRLLGVDRVAVYNTSCGPELDRLLRSYSQEGFVEIIPWPIDKHLNPSYGWQFSLSGGDVHYFGQQTTLNECMYRFMDRSRYVLLNDIDEIIMPYQHNSLAALMDELQQQLPNVMYLWCAFENPIFRMMINIHVSLFHVSVSYSLGRGLRY